MKLNPNAFGLAAVVTVAILWLVCSLVIMLIPGMSMTLSGYMMHGDFSGMAWHMNLAGFLAGLVVWGAFAYVFAWLMAAVYNRYS